MDISDGFLLNISQVWEMLPKDYMSLTFHQDELLLHRQKPYLFK